MAKQFVLHQNVWQRLQRGMDTTVAAVVTTPRPKAHNVILGRMSKILDDLFVIGFCLFAWAALILTLLRLA